jgi:hypothetical protein
MEHTLVFMAAYPPFRQIGMQKKPEAAIFSTRAFGLHWPAGLPGYGN